MSLADKLPNMVDKDLVSLLANARRIAGGVAGKQQVSASELAPLIEAEILRRKPAPVAKAPRKRAVPAA